MKILTVMGNGIPNSNTEKLADSFIKGAIEAGHEVEKVRLNKINDCLGCGACQKNGNKCVQKDDMTDLYQKFLDSEVLVLASPLYFWSISGRLKNFIDRLYAISVKDTYPEKKTILLMTSGDDKTWTFDQAVSYYHKLTQIFGGHDLGMCLAGGCTGCEEEKRDIPEHYLEEAYQLGKALSL